MDELTIRWTDYMQYRLRLRGFDVEVVEQIVRYSAERYTDTITGRHVAVGRHHDHLVAIPFDRDAKTLTPVTFHVTNRQQIAFRLKSGRFKA